MLGIGDGGGFVDDALGCRDVATQLNAQLQGRQLARGQVVHRILQGAQFEHAGGGLRPVAEVLGNALRTG